MRATSSRVRLALVFGASGLLLVFPNRASAQVIDPSEIVEEKLDEVEKLVDETTDTVEEVVDDAEETVDETVNETKETVDKVVDETVGQVNPPAQPKPPTTGPGGDNTDPAPGGANDGPKAERRPAPKVESLAQSKDVNADGSRTLEPFVPVPRVDVAPVAQLAQQPHFADDPVTPGEAAQRLAFPILMAGAVLLYLLMQGRFDRRDPKLLFDIETNTESLSFE